MLEGLPNKLLRKIDKLSKNTAVSVAELVEQSIALYERRFNPVVKGTSGGDRYDELMKDPDIRRVYAQVTEAIGLRASASMTPAQRKTRGKKGGIGRAKNLSSERRKEIARKAGQASAKKRAAKKAAAAKSVSD